MEKGEFGYWEATVRFPSSGIIMKILSILIGLLLCVCGGAQDYYFQTKVGSYTEHRVTGKNDELVARLTTFLTGSNNENGYIDSELQFQIHDAEGKAKYKKDDLLCMNVIIKDGESNASIDKISKIKSSQGFLTKGDASTLPPSMKVGDKIETSNIGIKIGMFKMKMIIWDRYVIANEVIKTPIGDFQCLKLEEKQTIKIMGMEEVIHLTSWYSKGIGLIKQIVRTPKGEMVQTFDIIGVN